MVATSHEQEAIEGAIGSALLVNRAGFRCRVFRDTPHHLQKHRPKLSWRLEPPGDSWPHVLRLRKQYAQHRVLEKALPFS